VPAEAGRVDGQVGDVGVGEVGGLDPPGTPVSDKPRHRLPPVTWFAPDVERSEDYPARRNEPERRMQS
jgi:hypothetical protein